jgi:hypothetical protein
MIGVKLLRSRLPIHQLLLPSLYALLGKEDFLLSPPFLSSPHFLVTYFSKRCASAVKMEGRLDNVENWRIFRDLTPVAENLAELIVTGGKRK